MIRAAVALGWGAAIAESCDKPFPTCKRCRRPDSSELRKSWGCDEEAPRDVWSAPCPRCQGLGDPTCSRCDGVGEVAYRRCPSSMVNEAPPWFRVQLDLLMRSYSHYDRRNVLPAQGAWLDQSRSFLSGIDMIDSERSHWEYLRIEHDRKEQERSRKMSQMKQSRGRR